MHLYFFPVPNFYNYLKICGSKQVMLSETLVEKSTFMSPSLQLFPHLLNLLVDIFIESLYWSIEVRSSSDFSGV